MFTSFCTFSVEVAINYKSLRKNNSTLKRTPASSSKNLSKRAHQVQELDRMKKSGILTILNVVLSIKPITFQVAKP